MGGQMNVIAVKAMLILVMLTLIVFQLGAYIDAYYFGYIR